MTRVEWPLRRGRPSVEIMLQLAATGQLYSRVLLADTGAGAQSFAIDLILDEDDCLLCGFLSVRSVVLGGAYSGSYPIYSIPVQIPALGFAINLWAVGVPSVPAGFDGIACFRFLNRFHYGNFGNAGVFRLEA